MAEAKAMAEAMVRVLMITVQITAVMMVSFMVVLLTEAVMVEAMMVVLLTEAVMVEVRIMALMAQTILRCDLRSISNELTNVYSVLTHSFMLIYVAPCANVHMVARKATCSHRLRWSIP